MQAKTRAFAIQNMISRRASSLPNGTTENTILKATTLYSRAKQILSARRMRAADGDILRFIHPSPFKTTDIKILPEMGRIFSLPVKSTGFIFNYYQRYFLINLSTVDQYFSGSTVEASACGAPGITNFSLSHAAAR